MAQEISLKAFVEQQLDAVIAEKEQLEEEYKLLLARQGAQFASQTLEEGDEEEEKEEAEEEEDLPS